MFKDISGQTFGRLTVVGRAENDKAGTARWNCSCVCGGASVTSGANLRRGTAQSCGCLHREISSSIAHIAQAAARKHGHAGLETAEYRTWTAMKARCENPKHRQYKNYGARGIKVCGRWQDFALFLSDMGPRPDGLSLDRENNEGNYEPGNCRWATYIEQQNNKRTNKIIEFDGISMTVADAIRAANLPTPKATINTRLWRGWSVEEAFT